MRTFMDAPLGLMMVSGRREATWMPWVAQAEMLYSRLKLFVAFAASSTNPNQ